MRTGGEHLGEHRDVEARERQHAGRDQPLVESAHDRLTRAELDEEGAEDRGDDADAADGERQGHHLRQDRRAPEEDRSQHHRRDRGHGVGLEQVRRHARAVADIVADVVGDGRRVAWIVLGDARFHLADQITADVRTLGEDAAAEAGEDRDQRRAEAERHERVDDDAVIGLQPVEMSEVDEVERHAEQREARDQKAGDRACLESQLKTASKRLSCSLCRADVCAHRDVHADEAGRTGEHRTDQEANRNKDTEEVSEQREDHDADDCDRHVLTAQIGLRAFPHCRRDFLHSRITGIGSQNRGGRPYRIDNRKCPTKHDQPQSCH